MKGAALVAVLAILFFVFDQVSTGRLWHADLQKVVPAPDGTVRLDISDLAEHEVRFYQFINTGNQEAEFLVGRDEFGVVQVGFNASENHYKLHRGFESQDGWIVDRKCETTSRLSGVNESNGLCKPVPLKHRFEGNTLVLREADILQGWRYFR